MTDDERDRQQADLDRICSRIRNSGPLPYLRVSTMSWEEWRRQVARDAQAIIDATEKAEC